MANIEFLLIVEILQGFVNNNNMLKKLSNLLLIFSIFFVSCTNESEEVVNYDNGNIKYKVNLVNGKREGAFLKYFPDGKLMMKSNWKGGVKSGESIQYFKNGKIDTKEYYTDGLPDGEIRNYDSLGNLRQIKQIKKGIFQGANTIYYATGEVEYIEIYKNDVLEGKAIEYYEDGTIKGKYIYHRDSVVYAIQYIDSSYVTNQLLKFKTTYDESNTFRVGDKQRIYVELLYSYYDDSKLGITLGSLDNLGGLSDTIFAKKSDSLMVTIEYVPTEVGENKIEGYAYEYTGESVEEVRKHIEIKFDVTE